MTRIALLAVALLPVLAAGCGTDGGDEGATGPGETAPPATSEPAPPVGDAPEAITEADSGRTFALAVGAETSLRLTSEYVWSDPVVSGDAVQLAPVNYIQDPGWVEWLVQAVAPGTATIESVGTPATCADADGCPDEELRFQVTIAVS